MSGGEIAALIASGAFVVLVLVIAVLIVKLGRTVDETTKLVAGINAQTGPLLSDLGGTVRQVNAQLERVDVITANAQAVTSNVSAFTSLFAATLGGPVVKVAAFTYGVRKAASGRRKSDTARRVKQEMKADRRHRRRRG
ncbi:MAG: DUF948 domain-containing protein [Mycobacteriales bacterium]